MSISTATATAATVSSTTTAGGGIGGGGGGGGGPPVPPAKPILSSPGAYMANFTAGSTNPATAGIHSVNKTHIGGGGGSGPSIEKPAIAARPIPPPTLPKYSSSFSKIDRERNEFGKIDRAEREKVRNFLYRNFLCYFFFSFRF